MGWTLTLLQREGARYPPTCAPPTDFPLDPDEQIVMMGSGSQIVEEAVNHLVAQGQKVGLVKVGGRREGGAGREPDTPHLIPHFTLVTPPP